MVERGLEKYEKALRHLGVSQETIECVISINGYNIDSLEEILYWKTGYTSFDQIGITDDEDEEED